MSFEEKAYRKQVRAMAGDSGCKDVMEGCNGVAGECRRWKVRYPSPFTSTLCAWQCPRGCGGGYDLGVHERQAEVGEASSAITMNENIRLH